MSITDTTPVPVNPADFVGRVVRFVAEPYESGELRIESCEWACDHRGDVTNYAVSIVGTVVSGTRTSRMFQYQSHRDIAGQTLELRRCYLSELIRDNLARYVYPV